MIAALRVFGTSFVALQENLGLLMAANLLWFVLSLPLSLVGYYGVFAAVGIAEPSLGELTPALVMILLLLLPNPAAGGLYLITSRLAAGEPVSFGLFWTGLRAHFLRGLSLFVIGLLLLVLVLYAARFYVAQPFLPFQILGLFFFCSLYLWLGMQLYVFPLLVSQSDRRVILVLRNALQLCLRHWPFTLVLLFLCLLSAAVGVLLAVPVPILLMSFLAVLESQALRALRAREKAMSGRGP